MLSGLQQVPLTVPALCIYNNVNEAEGAKRKKKSLMLSGHLWPVHINRISAL